MLLGLVEVVEEWAAGATNCRELGVAPEGQAGRSLRDVRDSKVQAVLLRHSCLQDRRLDHVDVRLSWFC